MRRPKTYGECLRAGLGVSLPCPWCSCRYNLRIRVTQGGRVVEVPTEESCALAVASRGAHSLHELAGLFGMTKQTISTAALIASAKLRASILANHHEPQTRKKRPTKTPAGGQ